MRKTTVELSGVPETALWTLYHRAVEACRPHAVLADPLAVELVERIEFPFAERFGAATHLSQWQALRARCFDNAVRRFLTTTDPGSGFKKPNDRGFETGTGGGGFDGCTEPKF